MSFTNGGWNRASLNDYNSVNPSQPDNNGNIHRMDHFVPTALDGSGNITSWAMAADAYTYDQLNRLLNVSETPTGGSGSSFVQQYTYDRWGNRKIDTTATSNVGGGVTDVDFQVTTANNRLLAPTDTGGGSDKMRYDAVGNLIWDEYSNPSNPARDFGYDAENHIGIVKNASGTELARYIYDPEGKRVRRIISGTETWQVYGLDGELIAEYAFNGSTSSPQKEYGYRGGQMLVVYDSTETGDKQWQWLVADHLGSPRMVVDRSGNLSGITRHDYYPFGEENLSGGTIRTTGNGYQADGVRQKFTGYERDTETNLDYAQARYYANVQGRFTSADPLHSSAEPREPQSWNRYIYVGNQPMTITDPSGLKWAYKVDKNGVTHYAWFNTDEEAVQKGWTVIKGNHFYIGSNGHLIGLYTNGAGRDFGTVKYVEERLNVWKDNQFSPFFIGMAQAYLFAFQGAQTVAAGAEIFALYKAINAARAAREGLTNVALIRTILGIGKNRNVAYATYEIEGLGADTLIGVSGRSSPAGTVAIPGKDRLFTTFEANFPRDFDSEVKILEEIGKGLETSARGTVRLFTERPACASCQSVINQFAERFPNIKVIVNSGKPD